MSKTGQFTRRSMLGALGVAAAGLVLAGCESAGSAPVVEMLPDRPPVGGGRSLVPDTDYAPPVRPQMSAPIRAVPQQANSFGIIPRSAWSREGPNLQTIDPMGGVKLITFHHSGDPKPFVTNDFGETALHLEYVREYHRSRKFQDIGYHFAIDRTGRVWQLRSLKYQGQHVRYNNEHNVGVVVLGNFDLQTMTTAQKERVKTFGSLLRKQYSLPIARVYTHKEIVKTECPGDQMQPFMNAVRKQALI